MASIQERFQAAVNVIKGLPKNGPYQPSYNMMLKFYGLYKQATEGECPQKKPAFWDVVNKSKWDAWNQNSHLSKEEAMQKYVENLQEIIETMSFTENVQNFVGSLQGLENINLDELDIISPGMKELAKSHPNSPFHSRTNSPLHSANEFVTDLNSNSPVSSLDTVATSPTPIQNVDLISQSSKRLRSSEISIADYSQTNGLGQSDQSDEEYVDPFDVQSEVYESLRRNTDILKQIQITVTRMNSDMTSINQRILDLERTLREVKSALANQKSTDKFLQFKHKYPNWWPFEDISPVWFVLLVLWPFVAKKTRVMLTQPKRN